MRVVLDTNVLVRFNKNSAGPARECLTQIQSKKHILLISQYLLTELARVLIYPRLLAQHRLSSEEIRDFLAAIEIVGEMVETPQDSLEAIVTTDPEDDPIIQLATAGRANVLCTLDRHIRTAVVQAHCAARGIRVLSDAELLAEFRKMEGQSSEPEN